MRLLLASLLFASLNAQAEYRVFRLQITSADGTSNQSLDSTLDPDQYRGYHAVQEGERVTYTDTWMCRGRTNLTPLCPNPRDLASESQSGSEPVNPPSSP